METDKQVLAKYEKAKNNKESNSFKSILEDAYKYCCPRRYNQDYDATKDIYDSTAVYAVRSRAANTHDQLFPAFREWINEEAVSVFDDKEKQEIERQLKERRDRAHKAIELSNFHISIEDTLTDAIFSDGAILVFAGTPEAPLKFQAVDWDRFYTLNDMDGEPNNNFLLRKLSLNEIKYKWPKADLSNFDKEQKELDVMDCYTYDEVAKVYTYSVFIGEKQRILATEEKSSPWVIFNQKIRRAAKSGWGPALDCMPNVRTTNQIEEYLLGNAAVAVSGMWQAEDDGVINPSNIKLAPGVVIPKAPGSKGLEPLVPGVSMNLTQFVLGEQKEDIKKSLQGSALPDFSQGVRSAQEYQLRDAEMKKTEIPDMLLLAQGSKRLVKRIFDILSSPQMISSAFYCKPVKTLEGKNVITAFTSPLIRLRGQIEMSQTIQTIATAAQLFGQAAYDILNSDELLRTYYAKNNLDPNLIRDEDDTEEYRQKNRREDIQLAQNGVKPTRPTPGNISLP